MIQLTAFFEIPCLRKLEENGNFRGILIKEMPRLNTAFGIVYATQPICRLRVQVYSIPSSSTNSPLFQKFDLSLHAVVRTLYNLYVFFSANGDVLEIFLMRLY